MNKFNKQAFLNIKQFYSNVYFSTYIPIHLGINPNCQQDFESGAKTMLTIG